MTRLFDSPLLLAPMAGVNDPVFRDICKRMGAGLTYTEMISAKGLDYQNHKTQAMFLAKQSEKPLAVQLFGSDPAIISRQAKNLEQELGDSLTLIDINMACPARKVTKNGDGAALMANPELAQKIIKATVNAVSIPVTIKIRKGYAAGENNAVEFAKMAEGCGVAAVAVHGRSAAQLYHGLADKELVGQVKQALSIPVIASGDVYSKCDIDEYLHKYAADAVMVARGARGNPWIFSGTTPTLEQRVAIAREHTTELAAWNPAKLSSMRRHIPWYFKGTAHAAAIRQAVNTCNTLGDYQALFEQILLPSHSLAPELHSSAVAGIAPGLSSRRSSGLSSRRSSTPSQNLPRTPQPQPAQRRVSLKRANEMLGI